MLLNLNNLFLSMRLLQIAIQHRTHEHSVLSWSGLPEIYRGQNVYYRWSKLHNGPTINPPFIILYKYYTIYLYKSQAPQKTAGLIYYLLSSLKSYKIRSSCGAFASVQSPTFFPLPRCLSTIAVILAGILGLFWSRVPQRLWNSSIIPLKS